MSATCPHCAGPKSETEEMCTACHALFHGPKKPATSADTAAESRHTGRQGTSLSDISPASNNDAALKSAANGKLIKRLIGIGVLGIVVIFVAVQLANFVDSIKVRTPRQKQAWIQKKVDAHDRAIQRYVAAQQAKGIFEFLSVDVTADGAVYNILQLSDPDLTDITADEEKFRVKVANMFGNTVPVYVETYYHNERGASHQVGSSIYSVAGSNMPGIDKGDTYPGVCYRIPLRGR